MQTRQLFEYAILRIVPRVEREEFINVGVILYCASQKFLQCKYLLEEDRLKALCSKTDITEMTGYLRAFEAISNGEQSAGPIAQ